MILLTCLFEKSSTLWGLENTNNFTLQDKSIVFDLLALPNSKVNENLVCLTCQLFDSKSTITIKLNDGFVKFDVINVGHASSEIEYGHKWNAKKIIANVNMKMTPRCLYSNAPLSTNNVIRLQFFLLLFIIKKKEELVKNGFN